MKITINIDCTPEEARSFLGFPDLRPVHDAYVERLRSVMEEGITPEMVARTLQQWGPLSEASVQMWSKLFGEAGKK